MLQQNTANLTIHWHLLSRSVCYVQWSLLRQSHIKFSHLRKI